MLVNEILKSQTGGDILGLNLTLDVKQCDVITGGSSEMRPPLRKVLQTIHCDSRKTCTDEMVYPVHIAPTKASKTTSESLLTCHSNLHKPEMCSKNHPGSDNWTRLLDMENDGVMYGTEVRSEGKERQRK